MVQWLGLRAFTAEAWVQSLVRKPKIPQATRHGQKKKKERKRNRGFGKEVILQYRSITLEKKGYSK